MGRRVLRSSSFGLALSLGLVGLAGLTGCAEVKPWERGVLAKPALDPSHPCRVGKESFNRHVFDVREGSSGGGGQAGGGCGCN